MRLPVPTHKGQYGIEIVNRRSIQCIPAYYREKNDGRYKNNYMLEGI